MSEQKGIGDQIGDQFEQYRQRVMQSEAVRTIQERVNTQGPDLVERVKQLASEAMVRRIAIQQDGRTLFELPLAVGLGGALLVPQLAALGAIAALITNCTITVEREEGGASHESSGPNGSSAQARGSSGEPVTSGSRPGSTSDPGSPGGSSDPGSPGGSSGAGTSGASGSSGASSTSGSAGSNTEGGSSPGTGGSSTSIGG